MSTEDVEIRPETLEDEAQIATLFKEAYGHPAPPETFMWWRNTNQLAAPQTAIPTGFVACVEDRVVGYLGLRLRQCLINGKSGIAGELVNGMVDASFRRRGISTLLCTRMKNVLCHYSVDIIYGIPNQKNERALAKAGFQMNLTYGRWVFTHNELLVLISRAKNGLKRLCSLPIMRNIKPTLATKSAASQAATLMPNWALDTAFIIQRSTDYWHIRYDDGPKNYAAYKTSDGCYVLKLDAYGALICATLVDLLPAHDTSTDTIAKLVKNAMEQAWQFGAQTFEARAIEGSQQESAIQTLGFTRSIGNFPLALAAEGSVLDGITQDSLWMTTGDFDIG